MRIPRLRRQAGVTLVELIVVLGLFGILTAAGAIAISQINTEAQIFGGRQNARLEGFMVIERVRRALWLTGTSGRTVTELAGGKGFRLETFSGGSRELAVTFETRCQKAPAGLKGIGNFGVVGGHCKKLACTRGNRPVITEIRKVRGRGTKSRVYPAGYRKEGSSRDSAVAAAVCFRHRATGTNIYEVEIWTAYRGRKGSSRAVKWMRQGVTLPTKPTISGNVAFLLPGS